MSEEVSKESALPENKEAEEKKGERPESPLEPEVLEKLPPEVRKAVEFSMFSGSVPVFNPIYKKITEGHIDKVLDQTENDSQREFKDRKSSRILSFCAFLVICALFVFITIYLTNVDKDLYRDVFKVIIGLIGGFGGGFAYKGYLDRNKD